MLISTKGRYSLRFIIDIVQHSDGGYIALRSVAKRQGLSEKYLESVLKTLVTNGILAGMRGKGGGYKLAMPPEECTVGQVLRLTEESLAPVACLEPGAEACPRCDECSTIELWKGLDRVIAEYLDSVTIADLVNRK